MVGFNAILLFIMSARAKGASCSVGGGVGGKKREVGRKIEKEVK